MRSLTARASAASYMPCVVVALLFAVPSCTVHREADIRAQKAQVAEECRSISASTALPAEHWSREWAGEYYVGDGLGMNVSVLLAPESGITYTWHGCLGLYDSGSGQVQSTFDDDGDGKIDGLVIRWTDRPHDSYRFHSLKWYFVRWPGPNGAPGRRYFVPEDQMLDLVDNYNEGGFSRDGMYFAPLKFNPEEGAGAHFAARAVPVEGTPQLPAQWARSLITVPFDAHVVSVSPGKSRSLAGVGNITLAQMSLDRGRADGLHHGMKIRIGRWADDSSMLTIDRLDEHTAEGTLEAFTAEGKVAALPSVGQAIRIGAGNSKTDN